MATTTPDVPASFYLPASAYDLPLAITAAVTDRAVAEGYGRWDGADFVMLPNRHGDKPAIGDDVFGELWFVHQGYATDNGPVFYIDRARSVLAP